ncbi:MAG: hypothetical protein H6573_20405 [Lewinellaceae bacterium]|nr:hypothetical protein [Lewinellaceae bacterium]
MKAVQKVKCINRAWFVLSFEVVGPNGHSLCSDDLPIQREGILDLTEGGFPEGTEVALRAKAVMGEALEAAEKLRVARNGRAAVFEVRGTSLDFRVELVAIREAED